FTSQDLEESPVSDHAATTAPEIPASHVAGNAPGAAKADPGRVWVDDAAGAAADTGLASPEFDAPEMAPFGKEGGQAVTGSGKMLVGFFFYSFLIMMAVALWTMSRGGQVDSTASHGEHAEEAEE